MNEEKKGVPAWAYLLGGVAVGAALGVLFAPKKGTELRADIKDWTKKRAEDGKAFLARMKAKEQVAMKAAHDAIAAVKERGQLVKS